MEEVLLFAREYINKPSTRTPERKAKIREVIKSLTGAILDASCSTCYIEAIFKILEKTKMTNRYELKKGYVAQFQEAYKGVKAFTTKTMTDELAEEYLKRYPSRVIFFARVPDLVNVVPPTINIIPPTIKIIPPQNKVAEPTEVKKESITLVKEKVRRTRKSKK